MHSCCFEFKTLGTYTSKKDTSYLEFNSYQIKDSLDQWKTIDVTNEKGSSANFIRSYSKLFDKLSREGSMRVPANIDRPFRIKKKNKIIDWEV